MFMITIKWLMEVLSNVPSSEWKDVVIAYDNMCHLDSLKAARNDLPLEAPFNIMWKSVTKIIDDLHIHNHTDPKCLEMYHPLKVRQQHPHYNLMCAEQTFVWLSRFKKIVSSMNKTHHCFFIHRTVKLRNSYTQVCMQYGRRPLLPKAKRKNDDDS